MKKLILFIIILITLYGCQDSSETLCPCVVTGVSTNGSDYDITVRGLYTINHNKVNEFTFQAEKAYELGDSLKIVKP